MTLPVPWLIPNDRLPEPSHTIDIGLIGSADRTLRLARWILLTGKRRQLLVGQRPPKRRCGKRPTRFGRVVGDSEVALLRHLRSGRRPVCG